MSPAVERGIGLQALVDGGEVAAHGQTGVREGASRIDERDQQRLPTKLAQCDLPPALVGKAKVRHEIAGRRNMILRLWLVVRLRLCRDHDLVNQGLVASN